MPQEQRRKVAVRTTALREMLGQFLELKSLGPDERFLGHRCSRQCPARRDTVTGTDGRVGQWGLGLLVEEVREGEQRLVNPGAGSGFRRALVTVGHGL